MPIIVEFTYKDGTKDRKTYPAQIWRYNDKEISKVFSSDKELESIAIDPNLETADVDTLLIIVGLRKQLTSLINLRSKIKG